MARAGARSMDPGREYRELEGQRKSKESKVSEASGYPEIDPQEFNAWITSRSKGSSTAFDKDRPYMPDMQDTSSGFMMHKDHPQLKDIQDKFDIFSLPGGRGNFLFLKQRVPMAEGPGPTQWETG
jgi:hypothetical protein